MSILTSIVWPYSFVVTYTKGIQNGGYIDIAEHATPTGTPVKRKSTVICLTITGLKTFKNYPF